MLFCWQQFCLILHTQRTAVVVRLHCVDESREKEFILLCVAENTLFVAKNEKNKFSRNLN